MLGDPHPDLARTVDSVLAALPVAAFRSDKDGVTRFANRAAEELLGLSTSDVVGRRYDQPALDVASTEGGIIDFDASPVPRALAGEHVKGFEVRARLPDGGMRIFCFDSTPLSNEQGRVVGAVTIGRDVTAQRSAEHALKVSERQLRAVLDNTRMAVFVMDERQHCTYANAAAEALTGYSFPEMVGRPLHDVVHHTRPDGSHYPLHECPIDRAFLENNHTEGTETFVRRDGSLYPVAFTASPIRDDGSNTIGTVIEARDIAQEIAIQRRLEVNAGELEEQGRALQILNRAASAISGNLELDAVVQAVTEAGVELTRAQFGAFFYNVVDAAGERYTLYTIAGVPREEFSKFPMPRKTEVFHPTFEGEGVVRSDDIKADPRYGRMKPHYGMPAGHLPVSSYLAVPVRSRDGDVLGGLFFGHAEPGKFSALDEDRISALASQAAIAIDNARLFQRSQWELEHRRKAESALLALNADLERRVAEEVAERAKAEEALRQAQKMEAIGQLTGGVAHDFNNLLTSIMGGLDIVRRSKPGDTARVQRATEMAFKSAQRAASLTNRLLAFARRQPLQPKPLDLNLVVRDMTDLLHRTLGEHIELEGVLAPRLWRIEADQHQLESALINLAVNARDAMPGGGKLTLETANTALDESYVLKDAEVTPGQYVMVCVSDTGSGMSRSVLDKVFEPFFTTKEVGKGTGLGLSMVYGFVKQSGGHVSIYSEEGHGTSVKLYFPRFFGEVERDDTPDQEALPCQGDGETILLVEDNEDVRAYSASVLRELGYDVVEAEEAEAALKVLRSGRKIDLLFTDVILPGKSGRVLADEATGLRPGLKVLYTTGYSRNAIVHHGRLDPGVALISKPFTFEQLAARVRAILDRASADPEPAVP